MPKYKFELEKSTYTYVHMYQYACMFISILKFDNAFIRIENIDEIFSIEHFVHRIFI